MGTPRSEAQPTGTRTAVIGGEALAGALAGGAEALHRQADAINAINVFPVPDGDTGTNMWMTMRAAADGVAAATDRSVFGIAAAAARGALMGAKGNSGVILSQILAGFAALPEGTDALDTRALADALERARAAAYHVVSTPREGTILTAISAAATGAAAYGGDDVIEALDAAVRATADAVARTPDLLPVLREAGVVDSGAQGLFVLLDGVLRTLRGDGAAEDGDGFGAIDASWLSATRHLHDGEGAQAGYCTEFVISGDGLDATDVRARLGTFGDSLLVVGGGAVVRVHVHTKRPQEALDAARTLGVVSREKVDDMEAQFRSLAAEAPEARGTVEGVAIVAVAAGAGLIALFESMGAHVVPGGQTMNPSAGDLRAAIEATGAADVILLPDNKNIVMAARLAAEGAGVQARVIETSSVPQGVAALVAYNSEATLEENIEAMTEAVSAVRTGEVTLAARATTIHGIAIREGQPIALIDGDIALAAESIDDAVIDCVARMAAGRDGAIVTLYAGDGIATGDADALAERLRAAGSGEVEVVAGGQPHYAYLIGVE